jgi:hypothetical protein
MTERCSDVVPSWTTDFHDSETSMAPTNGMSCHSATGAVFGSTDCFADLLSASTANGQLQTSAQAQQTGGDAPPRLTLASASLG